MARNYELWKFGWGSYKGFHRGEVSERLGEFTAELQRWRVRKNAFGWWTRVTLRFSPDSRARYHMWLRGDDWADVFENLGRGRIRVASRPRREGGAYLDLDVERVNDDRPTDFGVLRKLFPPEVWGDI